LLPRAGGYLLLEQSLCSNNKIGFDGSQVKCFELVIKARELYEPVFQE